MQELSLELAELGFEGIGDLEEAHVEEPPKAAGKDR
jgi:hypothetical protein